MSCVNGIQLSEESCSVVPEHVTIAAIFDSRFAWVSMTPLGSPVEPDENWIKAIASGSGR
ncbi:hypothetical protein D3C76_1077190 [compost metagenome]